jgi:DNA-binding NtrC family response regulator
MHITIRVSGRNSVETVCLEDGERVLVGRAPDPASLEANGSRAPVPARCVAVHSPNVSSNHLLLERRGEALRVTDLASRNGTWAKLPPSSEVWLCGSRFACTLGATHAGGLADEGPEPAIWTGRANYHDGVMAAIDAWLKKRDMPARIRTANPRAQPPLDGGGRMPLTSDRDLVIEPLRTMQDEWLDAIACIERYVTTQNALFNAEEELRDDGLVVASPLMRATVARVVEAATRGAGSLLLLGPSGSGKEGLARCFHRNARRAGPFVARNCAMFNRELVRSELFGAEKGAFTGSTQRIVGAVAMAHEGTLFLDEVGELSPDVQAMILRFLDRGEYEPVGLYGQTRTADVRLVCATNRELRAAALRGEFRLDLWFRLSVHVIEVPPLHRRFEDVVVYLRSRLLGDGRSLLDSLTDDSLALLRAHSWDGNFRELINFAQRLVPIASQGVVRREQCEELLAEGALVPVGRISRPCAVAPGGERDWSSLWDRAASAFAEDHAESMPQTWDDVKDYIESYLKPLLFAHLSGSEHLQSRSDLDLRTIAQRMDADRGTAVKQITRYLERFAR